MKVKKYFIIAAVLLLAVLVVIFVYQQNERNAGILPENPYVERIEGDIDLARYQPFTENNRLVRMEEPPNITFTENFPIVDGATAAVPVYMAMVQEIYVGLDADTVGKYAMTSTTDLAFTRLINGEVDIFFGAQPSKWQIQDAADRGVEFVLTPVAREAFVFFVHKNNPVDSLTVEQIQDIYQRNIVNWRDVDGRSGRILAFQRPENSGSQTIMQAMVMRDKPLATPLMEETARIMGDIIYQVATYRNYDQAIGYSFRYFATVMNPNDNIKLLAINGIEPTLENIRNGTYPFTVDVYAITAGSTNENVDTLIQWIVSEQGQSFIETVGYVRRH